jgi:hypothetical protein
MFLNIFGGKESPDVEMRDLEPTDREFYKNK